MKKLTVELGHQSYPIYIGEDLLEQKDLFNDYLGSRQIMIVTNETIAPLYLDRLQNNLSGYSVENIVLPDGEQYKNLEVMKDIITGLLQKRYSRDCSLIALGGGVIGDITGFAAACYQRGVNYIQVPTTVLAQVDSSVGGKTAVNHELGKNMIGAFYQPKAVITDITVLKTLENRQLKAGLAEVIKYGLIRDETFFEWLQINIKRLMERDPKALIYAIERSCRNKAEIVEIDEKESGIRALLNLGHTFGHAIETGLHYQDWLHGEAVATGMLMAADLSYRHGYLTEKEVTRIENILHAANLPVTLPSSLTPETMLDLMSVDKKAKDGSMYLVLLKGIGNAFVTNKFDHDKLQETLDRFSNAPEAA